MTGLDLETFLLLLGADLGAWAALSVAGVVVALLVWSSWGSRRVLRRCLVMSLAVHLGLVLYGSTVPSVRKVVRGGTSESTNRDHLRRIQVAPLADPGRPTARSGRTDGVPPLSRGPRLDLAATTPNLADPQIRVARPSRADRDGPGPSPGQALGPPVAMATATPRADRPGPKPLSPAARPDSDASASGVPPVPPAPVPPDMAEVDPSPVAGASPTANRRDRPTDPIRSAVIESAVGVSDRTLRNDVRLRPGRSGSAATGEQRPARLAATPVMPDGRTGGLMSSTPRADAGSASRGSPSQTDADPAQPDAAGGSPLALEVVTPPVRRTTSSATGLAALGERPAMRTPAEVPKVYRPRLEPDRTSRARLAGASAGSELAVERALEWLARHQDSDGRWNAAIARYENGTPVKGDGDFTAHCPRDEICAGECAYWEADTALTGLALLTYLGAGYTHLQGRYAETVEKGFAFLMAQQKPDGDLRGVSVVVGMYCHAMATLALCEGYALTGDVRLRDSVERATAFLVRSRARDHQAWRYKPGERIGDTSILGWVVMSLKSAKEVGITIPDELSIRRGVLAWLDRVSSGQAGGLACYQPAEPVTPTMTAEAWVCRQFLGVGGPGPASSEAAGFLLHNDSDRGRTNYYYWYYATLALYQHGGEPWTRWNGAIRDRIVGLQHRSGHRAGSWDPDDSLYGAKGGRIYCTALAALTLEVYYRYLRLYDDPKLPVEAGEPPGLVPPRREPASTALNPEDQ